ETPQCLVCVQRVAVLPAGIRRAFGDTTSEIAQLWEGVARIRRERLCGGKPRRNSPSEGHRTDPGPGAPAGRPTGRRPRRTGGCNARPPGPGWILVEDQPRHEPGHDIGADPGS